MATIRCHDQRFTSIEAIIFDKDGTLADVEAYLKRLGQQRSQLLDSRIPGIQEPLLLAFGVENDQLNPSGLLAVGSRRENEVAAAAYVAATGQDWVAALETAEAAFTEAEAYLERKADYTPPFPGTEEMLARLAGTNLKLGLLSSDTPDQVSDFMQRYGLASFVQAQWGVDGSPSKPDPALFHLLCAELQVAPDQTLMVGDSRMDIKMARAAQAAGCVGVTWGWQAANLAVAAEADVAIDQWTQLQVVH